MPSCRPYRGVLSRGLGLGGAALLAFGCGGDVVEPKTGEIDVTVSTTGAEPDPDGYTLSLDNLQGVPLDDNGARTLTVDQGNHTLTLSGLAANCEVNGERRRTVSVDAGASVPVLFEVACSDTAGGIRIVTATTGTLIDSDGYQVVLDANDPRPIGTVDTLELNALPPGDHQIQLLDVADNCSIAEGEPTRTVAVVAGMVAEVEFQVICAGNVDRWTPMTSGTEADLADVWGTSGSDVFTVGELGTDGENGFQLASLIFHYDGSAWMLQRRIRDVSLRGVWGATPTDVWAVGFDFLGNDARVLHYDGIEWSVVPGFESSGGETLALAAVWGSSASDVYAVGSEFDGEISLGLIFHYDGNAWERMTPPGDLLPTVADVWGSSSTDVYAVGTDQLADPLAGTVLHLEGGQWTPVLQEPDLTLTSVWGSSATDVFAAGFTVTEQGDEFIVAGAVRHFDGSAWTAMTIPSTGVLNDLWGTSANDVFAVGENGTILHYDGSDWTATNPTDRTLIGVWSSSPADAFAVGNGGLILHGTP
jgi:hypothetical protein